MIICTPVVPQFDALLWECSYKLLLPTPKAPCVTIKSIEGVGQGTKYGIEGFH